MPHAITTTELYVTVTETEQGAAIRDLDTYLTSQAPVDAQAPREDKAGRPARPRSPSLGRPDNPRSDASLTQVT